MERKTQLEPLSTARKKKDLFIAIAGAKRKTPSLTNHEVSKWRRRPKGPSVIGRSSCQNQPSTWRRWRTLVFFRGVLDTQPFDCIITGKATGWLHLSEMDDDTVFRALADANRRHLLDRLHAKNGQTLGELCRGLAMTRQAVTKHLSILESANLVSWKRRGREKLHFINPVPINEIAERWIYKFEQPRLRALSQLKKKLEGNDNE